jgi:hypothetical protein
MGQRTEADFIRASGAIISASQAEDMTASETLTELQENP